MLKQTFWDLRLEFWLFWLLLVTITISAKEIIIPEFVITCFHGIDELSQCITLPINFCKITAQTNELIDKMFPYLPQNYRNSTEPFLCESDSHLAGFYVPILWQNYLFFFHFFSQFCINYFLHHIIRFLIFFWLEGVGKGYI